jgi:hypothetical protein
LLWLGDAEFLGAGKDAKVTSHFPDMPYFELVEFRKGRVNPVIEGDHLAVIG